MVWGGITAHGRTPLVVVDGSLTEIRYRDEIVRQHVMPFIRNSQRNVILQQDNARPHTARVVSDYLRQQNVNVLPWPAMSPDLPPMEHVWDEMERRLRQEPNPPTTLDTLRRSLVRIWRSIPQAVLNKLIRSMRRRCEECIGANGGHTHY